MNLKEIVDLAAVIGSTVAVVSIAVTISIFQRQVARDRLYPDRANFNQLYSICYSCFVIVEKIAQQQKPTYFKSDTTKFYTREDYEPILLSIRAKIKETVYRNDALTDLSTSLWKHMDSIRGDIPNIAHYEDKMNELLKKIGEKVD